MTTATFDITTVEDLRAIYDQPKPAPAHKVIDLRFDDFVPHEFEVLPRIHEFLGLPFEEPERRRVREWLALDAARRRPSRRFTLAEFGLDAAQVNAAFAGYIGRYAEWL